ncbi:hypothetical protein [Leucobacter chromiiresistens]|uniref:Uncharacterized protein n=1 Tax=Leucobacter chromiiresistens TaxID=1079994 RepID=A0A147EDI6_9MICO|nr:hypothetical protein [Leucobacter chromiiresistens]KTR82455.1 hypothetical protein NS354_11250 [Leucobacter chromiiresistens]
MPRKTARSSLLRLRAGAAQALRPLVAAAAPPLGERRTAIGEGVRAPRPRGRADPLADRGSSLSEWERRLADKEAERLRRARAEAEEELRDVVRDKARVESEVEIARQNLDRARAALDSEQARISEAEARISEQIGARAELDDVVKILRTNIGDLEYVLEQESLAYAQAETRLAQVKREHDP